MITSWLIQAQGNEHELLGGTWNVGQVDVIAELYLVHLEQQNFPLLFD